MSRISFCPLHLARNKNIVQCHVGGWFEDRVRVSRAQYRGTFVFGLEPVDDVADRNILEVLVLSESVTPGGWIRHFPSHQCYFCVNSHSLGECLSKFERPASLERYALGRETNEGRYCRHELEEESDFEIVA
jgi:hypothetical protein